MDRRGKVELTFGHGHRLSLKDTTDEVALAALTAEVEAAQALSDEREGQLGRVLVALLQKVNLIMADLDALKTADANIQSSVAAAGNELHTLAARLADASANNDQAGIDAVTADLQQAASNLTEAVGAATAVQADPQPAPAPATTDTPAQEASAPETAPTVDNTAAAATADSPSVEPGQAVGEQQVETTQVEGTQVSEEQAEPAGPVVSDTPDAGTAPATDASTVTSPEESAS